MKIQKTLAVKFIISLNKSGYAFNTIRIQNSNLGKGFSCKVFDFINIHDVQKI